MSMEGASSAPAASTPSPAAAPPIDPVHTAWPKMKNPGEGTLAGHQPGPPSRVKPEKQAASVSTPKAASQPLAGPSPSKPSPLVQTSIPENSDRPSLAKTLMPEGETLNYRENTFFNKLYRPQDLVTDSEDRPLQLLHQEAGRQRDREPLGRPQAQASRGQKIRRKSEGGGWHSLTNCRSLLLVGSNRKQLNRHVKCERLMESIIDS